MGVPVFDKVLIGGRWIAAARGGYAVTNPATEEPAGYAPECSPEQVRDAARAAREAFDRGPWRRMDGAERGKLLVAAAERFRREAPGLVELTIAGTGAVRPVAQRRQVRQAGERLARYGALAAGPTEQRLSEIEARAPWGGGVASGLMVREPIGVVAC